MNNHDYTMQMSDKKRALLKTVSWRVIATITTALLVGAVLLVGEPSGASEGLTAAGIIALIEIPVKMGLYYLHELSWAQIEGDK